MVLKPFTFWELLILGGLIVFSLWQRYDWGMHLMLQAVTWRDLHLDCWCYAGCNSQMCVCVIVQSDIHWCMSSTCLGRDCKWKRVSLSKCMCLFVCLACTPLRIHHISTLISHLYAWQIMSAYTRLWKADSVFVDVKHQRVSWIISSLSSCFGIHKKNKGRQKSSEGSGVFLSYSVMRVAEKEKRKATKSSAVLF